MGISAIGFAIASARERASRNQRAGFLALFSGSLGAVGTILCLWSVAGFYAPNYVSPVPDLRALIGQVSGRVAPPAPAVAPVPQAGSRTVTPIEGADVTSPEQQLHANVRHVAFDLCIGVSYAKQMQDQYGAQFGGVPPALTVAQDGTVAGGNATYSKLPADMALEYSATPEGAYWLTVRDIASGLGVGCDSTSNMVTDR